MASKFEKIVDLIGGAIPFSGMQPLLRDKFTLTDKHMYYQNK